MSTGLIFCLRFVYAYGKIELNKELRKEVKIMDSLNVVSFLEIVRKQGFTIPNFAKSYGVNALYDKEEISFVYPKEIFYNLKFENKVGFFTSNLSERREQLKLLLDAFKEQEIPIFLFHLGIFVIYGENPQIYIKDDVKESIVGKRRVELFASIPKFSLISNDEFIGDAWHSLIRYFDNIDWQRNPSFKDVRLLFNPEFFGNYGTTYYDVDWVEPIPNAEQNKCYTYTKETDPMNEVKNDDYIVGPIIVGTDGGGLRHFVNGRPINAGKGIEIRFGKGWIEGRYEWSFQKDSPIRIYAGGEMIQILEGHIVRIKK